MEVSEEWRDIPNYNGMYQVSNLGRVRSFHNGRWGKRARPRIMKPFPDRQGYVAVDLRDGCKNVHRLVAKCFIKNEHDKKYVNHKNGVKDDNRVINLEWVTASENSMHAAKLGLKNGDRHGHSKINYQIACNIRQDRDNGMTQVAIASKYGISRRNVRSIISRNTWKHSETQNQMEVSYRKP